MWGNSTLFHKAKSIDKNIGKRYELTKLIEKNLLIDPLNTNKEVYSDFVNKQLSKATVHRTKLLNKFLNPIQDQPFRGCSGKKVASLKSITHVLQ